MKLTKKTPKKKHPNLHLKSILGKKHPKKTPIFKYPPKKHPEKKHQFRKTPKKTPTGKTPISKKGQKNTPKNHPKKTPS